MARDKPLVGRVTYANGDTQEFTDAEAFLKCVREELPYRPTTGFRYEVLTDDPSVRKQVDDMIFDLLRRGKSPPVGGISKNAQTGHDNGRNVSDGQKNGEFYQGAVSPPAPASGSIRWTIPYAPILPGTEGEVDFVDDAGQLLMKWDNGRTLPLAPRRGQLHRAAAQADHP